MAPEADWQLPTEVVKLQKPGSLSELSMHLAHDTPTYIHKECT